MALHSTLVPSTVNCTSVRIFRTIRNPRNTRNLKLRTQTLAATESTEMHVDVFNIHECSGVLADFECSVNSALNGDRTLMKFTVKDP